LGLDKNMHLIKKNNENAINAKKKSIAEKVQKFRKNRN
jgi:hypothetical protein